jgi:hypothetical protein
MTHINQLKFEPKDDWSAQFNKCSDLFALAFDDSISKELQDAAWKKYIWERQKLELGMY